MNDTQNTFSINITEHVDALHWLAEIQTNITKLDDVYGSQLPQYYEQLELMSACVNLLKKSIYNSEKINNTRIEFTIL